MGWERAARRRPQPRVLIAQIKPLDPREYSRAMRALAASIAIAFLAAPLAASAADGQPRKALTKAGQEAARSVVLKRGDLGPGFAPHARGKDEGTPKGARCRALDEDDLTVTGDAASPDFRLAQGALFVTVGSTAQVYRTLREANTSWRRGASGPRLSTRWRSSGRGGGGARLRR